MDSDEESDFISSLLKNLPFILGGFGVIFILIGIFSPNIFSEKEKKIVISDTLSTESSSEKIFIDVEGAVIKPGVYQLLLGARIQDVLISAGGLSEEADREWIAKNLNLAVKLVDGSKIYIPKVGEVLGEVQSQAEEIININTASLSELDKLSGIGPVTAQKIVDGRPYQKIEELLEKKVVSNSIWEKIKDYIGL